MLEKESGMERVCVCVCVCVHAHVCVVGGMTNKKRKEELESKDIK